MYIPQRKPAPNTVPQDGSVSNISPNGYWQPGVQDTPQMSYPSITQAPQRPRNALGAYHLGAGAAGQNFAAGQPVNPRATFGLNSVGAFGFGQEDGTGMDRGVFGVPAGQFGGSGDTMRKTINMRGGGGLSGGFGGGGLGGGVGGGGMVGDGAGSGFSGGGGGAGNLASSFQAALDKSNQANEARYRDILGGYQSRYERGMGMLSGLGQQQAKDVNQQYDNQASQIQQDLIGRGLGNSTVLSTMKMGNERERAAALGRVNAQLQQQALGTDAGLSGDQLNFMERKNENGPQMQMLAQLAQGLGQAGYGAGVGGIPAAGSGGIGSGLGMGSIGMMDPMALFGGGMSMGGGGGYVSPNAGFQDQRQAQARAIYSARNAGSSVDPAYAIWAGSTPSSGSPVSGDYASSWLPDDVQASIASRNAMNAWGQNLGASPSTGYDVNNWDPYTSGTPYAVGGVF